MKQNRNKNLLGFILVICSVVFIFTQAAYAQSQNSGKDETLTVVEFCSKSEQEQMKIINNLVKKSLDEIYASSKVENTEVPPSSNNRVANLVIAYFTEDLNAPKTKDSPVEPVGYTILKSRAKNYRTSEPNQWVWNLLVLFVNTEYDKYYKNQADSWKEKFNLLTGKQQETHFRAEILKNNKMFILEAQIAKLEAETVVNGLKISFRASKSNPSKLVLILKNETKYTAGFDLKCKSKSNKAKTLSISMPTKGFKELGEGKSSNFENGERCEIFHGAKLLRSFFTSSDKSLKGTTWLLDDGEDELSLIFADIDKYGDIVTYYGLGGLVNNKGTYTKSGNIVLMDFSSHTFEGIINGNRMEIISTNKETNYKDKLIARNEN